MWKQKQIHNDEQSIESFVGMPWSKVTECQRKNKYFWHGKKNTVAQMDISSLRNIWETMRQKKLLKVCKDANKDD